jgi:hypothetical protein
MRVQWLGSKESWDKIRAMGMKWNDWSPGLMGSDTFYIETIRTKTIVNKGDWIVKSEDGKFSVA